MPGSRWRCWQAQLWPYSIAQCTQLPPTPKAVQQLFDTSGTKATAGLKNKGCQLVCKKQTKMTKLRTPCRLKQRCCVFLCSFRWHAGTPAGNAPIVSEGRVTITPLLITPVAASSKTQPAGSKAAGAEADAAADTADGSAEPAAKKPRHEGPAVEGLAQPAAAAAATGSNTRGTASVHSTPRSQQPVACYVCQFASIPGKFDPQKAAQLGVPKGPVSHSVLCWSGGSHLKHCTLLQPSSQCRVQLIHPGLCVG